MIKAVAIIVKAGFGIKVFCREAMAEEIGERAELQDEIAKGIVDVLRCGAAIGIEIMSDVAVVSGGAT